MHPVSRFSWRTKLCVGICLSATLLLLLLHFIQSAREANRRSRCTNNLRGIGLALQAYQARSPQLSSRANDDLAAFGAIPVARPDQPMDRMGDPLPNRALARLGTLRYRSKGFTRAVISDDGSRLVTAHSDGVARLWELNEGRMVRAVQSTLNPIRIIAISSDASQIAVGDEQGDFSVFLAMTGDLIRRWQFDSLPELPPSVIPIEVTAAVFVRESPLIAIGRSDGQLRLLDAESGQVSIVQSSVRSRITSIEVASQRNRLLVSSASGEILVIDAELRQATGQFPRQDKPIRQLSLSPDAQLLAVSTGEPNESSTVRLYDMTEHAGNDQAIVKYEFSAGRPTANLALLDDNCSVFVLNDDGTAWVGPKENPEVEEFTVGLQPKIAVISRNRRTMACIGDSHIDVWDIPGRSCRTAKMGHRDGPGRLVFSDSGRWLLSESTENHAESRLWNVNTADCLTVFGEYDTALCFDAYDAVVFRRRDQGEWPWYRDDKLRLWRFDPHRHSSALVREIKTQWGEPRRISSPGLYVFEAFGDHASVFDVREGRFFFNPLRFQLGVKEESLSLVEVSSDGGCLLISVKMKNDSFQTRHFCFADLRNGKGPFPYLPRCNTAIMSADGRTIAILDRVSSKGGTDCIVTFLDAGDLAEIGSINAKSSRCQVLSNDGQFFACGNYDGSIDLYRVADTRHVARLVGHNGEVTAVRFSQDLSRLASGSVDTTILIWDLAGVSESLGLPESTEE